MNATVRLHTGIFSSQGGVWTPSPTITVSLSSKGHTHVHYWTYYSPSPEVNLFSAWGNFPSVFLPELMMGTLSCLAYKLAWLRTFSLQEDFVCDFFPTREDSWVTGCQMLGLTMQLTILALHHQPFLKIYKKRNLEKSLFFSPEWEIWLDRRSLTPFLILTFIIFRASHPREKLTCFKRKYIASWLLESE